MNALLLNADYQPIKVIPWERAITLLYDGRAELVEAYAGRVLHSVTESFPWPAVLRLLDFIARRPRMRFTRLNVLARDGYRCVYCGVAPVRKNWQPRLEELTLDHVVPRAQSVGGRVRQWRSGRQISVTCWENVVACCVECNLHKADRTPEQAGMKLARAPHVPTPRDVLRMHLRRVVIPHEWKAWLPAGAEAWAGYWDGELDND